MSDVELVAEMKKASDADLDQQYAALDLPENIWPKHLIQRCKEWHVNPGIFNLQASFDRVLVWQILDLDVEKTDDGNWKPKGSSGAVVLPGRALERSKNMSPRGIVFSAGLAALEHLHTNGIEIGDYVRLIRLNPQRVPCGLDQGFNPVYSILGDAGSIAAAEDLADALKARRITREWATKTLPNGDKWYGYCYKGKMTSGREIPDVPPIAAKSEELV